MKNMNVKERIIVGGALLILAFNLYPKDSMIQTEMNIVAQHVQQIGSVWYVNDEILDRAFKQGIWNPKVGDRIDLKLNDKGWVVEWKVRRIDF